MVEAERPGASRPNKLANASENSPVEMPFKYNHGNSSSIVFVRRKYGGRITELNLATAITYPRCLDRNVTNPGLDRALRQIAIAHHASSPRTVLLVRVLRHKFRHFRLDGLRQQRPCTFAQHLCQRVAYFARDRPVASCKNLFERGFVASSKNLFVNCPSKSLLRPSCRALIWMICCQPRA